MPSVVRLLGYDRRARQLYLPLLQPLAQYLGRRSDNKSALLHAAILGVLAEEAMKRETGVRSLRSMFEEVLLELRFDINKRKGEQVVITGDYVEDALRRGSDNLVEREQRDSA